MGREEATNSKEKDEGNDGGEELVDSLGGERTLIIGEKKRKQKNEKR